MKIIFLFFTVCTAFTGCNSTHGTAEKKEGNMPAGAVAETANARSVIAQQPPQAAIDSQKISEYLDRSTLRINNSVPLITTLKSIETFLGRPDSVINIDFYEVCASAFRSEDSQLAYYRGVAFEQFGDSLDFQHIDFYHTRDIFLQSRDLRLDHATTLEDLKKHFPDAVRNKSKMNVYGIGEVETINIPPSKEPVDGSWLLMFREGRLIRMEDWFPC